MVVHRSGSDIVRAEPLKDVCSSSTERSQSCGQCDCLHDVSVVNVIDAVQVGSGLESSRVTTRNEGKCGAPGDATADALSRSCA